MPMGIKNIYSCPKCGHPVGWRRRFRGGIYNQWPCKNCGTLLYIGLWRYFILIPTIWVPTHLWVKPYVDFWIFIGILVLGMFSALIVDPVVEKQELQRPDAE